MIRALVLLAGLAACGVAGPPVPPEGAVPEVVKDGVDLAPARGGL